MRHLNLAFPDDREALLALRQGSLDDEALSLCVRDILREVRADGDAAVRRFTERFDGVVVRSPSLSQAALDEAAKACDPELRRILEKAADRIGSFHAAQQPRSYELAGGRVEQRIRPLDRVGLYVPGGRASYPSTVLMSAVPARVAGVRELFVATPPNGEGGLDPAIAAACLIAGVDRVFLMGGAQAVGAFAFGTAAVPRVDKICGPGNAWVAEAKRQVAGQVGIDLFAGPSEVVVFATDGDPEVIAQDLLAQAEHDPAAVALCVTTDRNIWHALPRAVARILAESPNEAAAASIEANGAVVFADTVDQAIDFINAFAPEHLQVPDDAIADRITAAGAIFVGDFSPEPVGDYLAGPNHTLPTAGSARFSSGLGVHDFVRRINVVRWGARDLAQHGPDIARFARAEGLEHHARAVECRLGARAGRRSEDGVGYVLPEVRRQRAYSLKAPPAAPVKLNQNEAPEDLPSDLKERLLNRFRGLDWRRYPDFEPTLLKSALATSDGWRRDGVLIGNGSNELLTLLMRSVIGPGDTVTLATPSFSLYPLHLDVAGARIRQVPLRSDQDFAYDEEALLAAARTSKLVLLASPNNPTGSVLARQTVKRLIEETEALVVIDEAYRDFANQDLAPLLGPKTPLVLLRTWSKALALAGLRFGYLLGPPALCSELHKVVLPYGVNSLTQAAVQELLSHRRLIEARVQAVQQERSSLATALRQKGRRVIEGGANFLLFDSSDPSHEFDRLLEMGVLVRDLSAAVPGFLRVSIGTPAESARFLDALEEIRLQDALDEMRQ